LNIGRDTSYSDGGFLLFSSAPPGECVCEWFHPLLSQFSIGLSNRVPVSVLFSSAAYC